MKIQLFSDIHGDLRALERLLAVEADYYVAAGDLVNWARGLDRVGEAMKGRAGKLGVIPGNHESPADISAFCARYGLDDLHGRTRPAGPFQLAALGCSSPTPFNTPGEYSESEIAQRLSAFNGLSPLILVCHCPPKATLLDCAGPGQHFGSSAVRDFLQREKPRYFFCGHIHEAEGVSEQFGPTAGLNVGKRGYLLEIEA